MFNIHACVLICCTKIAIAYNTHKQTRAKNARAWREPIYAWIATYIYTHKSCIESTSCIAANVYTDTSTTTIFMTSRKLTIGTQATKWIWYQTAKRQQNHSTLQGQDPKSQKIYWESPNDCNDTCSVCAWLRNRRPVCSGDGDCGAELAKPSSSSRCSWYSAITSSILQKDAVDPGPGLLGCRVIMWLVAVLSLVNRVRSYTGKSSFFWSHLLHLHSTLPESNAVYRSPRFWRTFLRSSSCSAALMLTTQQRAECANRVMCTMHTVQL